MTVIAWDGKSIAADRQRSGENIVFDGGCKIKTQALEDGSIKAVVSQGATDVGLWLKAWVLAGERIEDFPKNTDDYTMVIVATKASLYAYMRSPIKIQFPSSKYMAWGAGNELALGALAMGATAEQAVKIACQYSSSCGFGCDVIHF